VTPRQRLTATLDRLSDAELLVVQATASALVINRALADPGPPPPAVTRYALARSCDGRLWTGRFGPALDPLVTANRREAFAFASRAEAEQTAPRDFTVVAIGAADDQESAG
jgi:hypothetical protein